MRWPWARKRRETILESISRNGVERAVIEPAKVLLEMTAESAFAPLVGVYRAFLDNAPNFKAAELIVSFPAGEERFVVIVQRAQGQTPVEVMRRLHEDKQMLGEQIRRRDELINLVREICLKPRSSYPEMVTMRDSILRALKTLTEIAK